MKDDDQTDISNGLLWFAGIIGITRDNMKATGTKYAVSKNLVDGISLRVTLSPLVILVTHCVFEQKKQFFF